MSTCCLPLKKEKRMKRRKLAMMLVVSLVLSHYAQAAGTESVRSPLTAPEKAQCRTQLTEFNQGVRSYNTQVDAIKALEAEVTTLGAAIEKDQATIDRRDSAAMQALNTQIDKNNELITRHEQMKASLKALSSENKQRSAQFSEVCETRPVAASPSSTTPPPDAACSSAIGAKGVERQIEATFADMRADEKKHQAEVDGVAKERAKAQVWNDEKRGKIWLQILRAPKFMAFQNQKQPYVDELMRILGSKPKNGQEECRLVQRIAAMLPAIKAINARQYAFMADEIRAAK
jgi:hypothetical protein